MDFKIRCSAIGNIMTNPRSKADKEAGILSETSKTYCQVWLKENLFNKKKEISTKYMTKGIWVENEAIKFLNKNSDYLNLSKNKNKYDNGFIKGTPDLVLQNEVIDIKCSWDLFSFPLFIKDIDKKYWWQLQGYMELTGKENATLAYVLINTPETIISREVSWKIRDRETITEQEHKELKNNYVYDDINEEFRIKLYTFNKDDDAIKQIKSRVTECRSYINELLKMIN